MALLSKQCSPRALLYLWPCSSVDDTISNSLSWVLFERACKLKCRMHFFSPSLHPSFVWIVLYSYTAECCSEHDFVSKPLI